ADTWETFACISPEAPDAHSHHFTVHACRLVGARAHQTRLRASRAGSGAGTGRCRSGPTGAGGERFRRSRRSLLRAPRPGLLRMGGQGRDLLGANACRASKRAAGRGARHAARHAIPWTAQSADTGAPPPQSRLSCPPHSKKPATFIAGFLLGAVFGLARSQPRHRPRALRSALTLTRMSSVISPPENSATIDSAKPLPMETWGWVEMPGM